MKYYKLVLIFLLFFSLSYTTYAKDAEKLEVEFDQTKKIQIQGITKFAIVNPGIIKVELSGNTLNITGIKYGSTPLFIWKNNEIIPYVIYSVAPKNIIKYNNNQIVYNINYNKAYGYYTLFSSLSNAGQLSNQSLYHQLYYKFPFYSGFFTFNGIFNNNFLNLKEVQSIDINNINLTYNDKNIRLAIGDISGQFGYGISSRLGQLKGGSAEYSSTRYFLNAFAGVESLPLTIYSKNYIINENNIVGGLYARVSPLDNISVSGNYTLRLRTNNTNEPNLLGSIRWSPLNSLFVATDVGTDFKSRIAYNINSSFYHGWQESKEYIRINALANHSDANYAYTYSTDRSNYLTNAFFKHRSGTNISASIGRFEQAGLKNDNLSLRASRIFEKYYNVLGEISYNNSSYDTSTRYSIGTEITSFLPINLNYSYAQGLRGGLFNENTFAGSVNLFETDNLRNIFSTSVRYNNSSYNKEEISSLQANFYLGFYYSGIKKVNLSTSLGYGRYIPNTKNSFINNNYSLNLSGSWNYSIYNKFNVSLGVTKDDLNNFNVYSNIGYSYYFGQAIDDAYTVGTIKGSVFEDENYNNKLDPEERIIPNVKLKIADKNVTTDLNGYIVSGVDYGIYEAIIDKDSLPDGYRTISNNIETVILENKTKEYNIPVRYESIIKGNIYSGQKTGFGLADIKIIVDDKDSVITDSEGYFSISVKPGKHTLKLDYTTIPSGYIFNQSLSREIETGKEDTEVNFTFNPVRIIRIQAYETNSLNQSYSQEMKVVKDMEITVSYPDGKIENLKTDEDGSIILDDLQTGTIQINSKDLKEPITIEVPEGKFQRDIEIPVLVK